MGPLLPACSPAPASAGAANGPPNRLLQEELVVPGGLLLRAVDRQPSTGGSELRSDPPLVQRQPESQRLHHHIDIRIQAGEEHRDFINDPVRDHAKTGPEGITEDGTPDASDSDAPRHVPTPGGTDDDISSTSDDAPSDDGSSSSDVSGEDCYNSEGDDEAASSSSSSAISSTSSLHYPSASSSSSEASTLTTASSRRNGPTEVGGVVGAEEEEDDALVLIGCRMCLTYYMVKKPPVGCPRCGHQGEHIVRFGG